MGVVAGHRPRPAHAAAVGSRRRRHRISPRRAVLHAIPHPHAPAALGDGGDRDHRCVIPRPSSDPRRRPSRPSPSTPAIPDRSASLVPEFTPSPPDVRFPRLCRIRPIFLPSVIRSVLPSHRPLYPQFILYPAFPLLPRSLH